MERDEVLIHQGESIYGIHSTLSGVRNEFTNFYLFFLSTLFRVVVSSLPPSLSL
jgi:hypothetical protein